MENQVALVTGAGSGFGRAIARSFAREGAAVVVADLDGATAREVARDISDAGGQAQAAEVDITDAAGLHDVVEMTQNVLGGLSALVANAGIGQRPIPATETPADEMRRQFEVNAIGAALTCQAALPALRKHGPGASITLTVSGIALQPRPEFLAYGMAKAAAAQLMKSLAADLAPEGIRVNGLFPAIANTGMFADFSDGDGTKASAFADAMPLGRLVTPEDVAAAAVFLASPKEAGAMTGCALPVDAGRTM